MGERGDAFGSRRDQSQRQLWQDQAEEMGKKGNGKERDRGLLGQKLLEEGCGESLFNSFCAHCSVRLRSNYLSNIMHSTGPGALVILAFGVVGFAPVTAVTAVIT